MILIAPFYKSSTANIRRYTPYFCQLIPHMCSPPIVPPPWAVAAREVDINLSVCKGAPTQIWGPDDFRFLSQLSPQKQTL